MRNHITDDNCITTIQTLGISLCVFTVFLLCFTITPIHVSAQNIDELKEKIEERKERIDEIGKEIQQYQKQVQVTSQEADTLENKVANLRASQRQIQAEIDVMENEIASKGYTIDKLSAEIQNIQLHIENNKKAIAETLREINESDKQSLVETFLIHDNISSFYNEVETLNRFQDHARARVLSLQQLRSDIEDRQRKTKQTKQELEQLHNQLADKNKVLTYNKQETEEILTKTKNKESRYRKLLEERKRQREAFKQEMNRLESQIQIAIDTNKFPEPGTKILSSPVPDPTRQSCWNGGEAYANCVTQYFGNTSFSRRTNAYKGKGHNGVDFRTQIGTPITSADSGTVRGTGNTDSIPGCYSYGKWVLITHNNGLSTLYAHLSVISVTENTQVDSNTIIGYAGNTGFSTGPHLHFTTYATEGVRVTPYTSSINCKNATIPVADQDAYLDPFNYLNI